MVFQILIAFLILIITSIFCWDDGSLRTKKRLYREDIVPDEKAYRYMGLSGRLASKVEHRFLKVYSGSVNNGGGCLSSGVEEVDFGYRVHCDPTIEATRAVLLDLYELFCEIYNSDEKVRPYLTNYPFGPTNTRLAIYPIDKEGHLIYNGKNIWLAAYYDGIFVYSTMTHEPRPAKDILIETIEAARAIVEAQRKGEKNVN